MPRDERHTATIPYGTLGIVPLKSCSKWAKRLMITLYNGENKREHENQSNLCILADTKETAML